ncbi:MAG: hypothetical protein WBP09_01020, partial [Propionicimonas sp.]
MSGVIAPRQRATQPKWCLAAGGRGAPVAAGPLTYNDTIGPLFQGKCSACHGGTAMGGLNLLT